MISLIPGHWVSKIYSLPFRATSAYQGRELNCETEAPVASVATTALIRSHCAFRGRYMCIYICVYMYVYVCVHEGCNHSENKSKTRTVGISLLVGIKLRKNWHAYAELEGTR